ncbi:MAG: SRPBCC family protein, partial [Mycobacteriaceae bacterium]|nr:SRPBCC family protein [Mycobacteriaceae bacterium]
MGRFHHYTDVRRVAVDPATAWNVISDHERMSEWTPARAVVLENPGRPEEGGVGAVRALHMWGRTIRERVTAFEPPRRLEYELVSGLPFRDYSGQITIVPSG